MPFPDRRFRRARIPAILAGGAVAAGVVGIGWVSGAYGLQPIIPGAARPGAARATEVRTAFAEALRADRAADAPPASAHLAAAGPGRPAGMPDAAQRRRQLTDGLAVLAQHFTPAQAEHEAIGLRNSVKSEADPAFRNLGSGVSKVVFTQVSVSGTRAVVQAAVTVWAKFQQERPDGAWNTADPVGVVDYTATLTQNSSGKWLIASLKGDFAPNEGP